MKEEVLAHFPRDQRPEIKGFLLVEFIPYSPALGNETMLGFRQDREFGPVVLISKGGAVMRSSLPATTIPLTSCFRPP